MQRLIAASEDAASVVDNWDNNALLLAAQAGHAAIVRLLFDSKLFSHTDKNHYGRTALYLALEASHFEAALVIYHQAVQAGQGTSCLMAAGASAAQQAELKSARQAHMTAIKALSARLPAALVGLTARFFAPELAKGEAARLAQYQVLQARAAKCSPRPYLSRSLGNDSVIPAKEEVDALSRQVASCATP